MRLIVDRIENGILICVKEDRSVITFNLAEYEISEQIREGDSVYIRNKVICIDYEHTKENKKNIDKLCKNMWDE